MQIRFVSHNPLRPANPLRRLAGLVVTVVVALGALMFSAVFFTAIVIIGVMAWTYLWWKTREVRKLMRELSRNGMTPQARASNDEVFEGEVIRVMDPRDAR